MIRFKNWLFLASLATMSLIYSCKKTDTSGSNNNNNNNNPPAGPTVTITQDKTNASPQDFVTFTLKITPQSGTTLSKVLRDDAIGDTMTFLMAGRNTDTTLADLFYVPNGATGTITVKYTASDNS